MEKTNTKQKGWIFYLMIVIAMYVYYVYLWSDFIFYDGKAGWKGFGLFMCTLFTAPLYIILHISVSFISRSEGAKKTAIVNAVGLIACILHICGVAAALFM